MAIQISGSTIIDDSRNIVNAGVVTASSFSGDGSNLTGVGIGTDGSVNTSGIITAYAVYAEQFVGTGDKLIFSPTVASFSPTDGATDVAPTTNIVLTFDQQIYAGVGSVFLRNSSGIGTVIEAIGIASTQITINNQTLTIDPSSTLPEGTDVYVVLPQGVLINTVGGNSALLDTYNFTTKLTGPGDPYEGGYLICQSGGLRWVVSPFSAEVSRNWYSREDANTNANAQAPCGDWFIPTCAQMLNPGYSCRTYWDGYSLEGYWNSTQNDSQHAWFVNFVDGGTPRALKTVTLCARSFRCVSY